MNTIKAFLPRAVIGGVLTAALAATSCVSFPHDIRGVVVGERYDDRGAYHLILRRTDMAGQHDPLDFTVQGPKSEVTVAGLRFETYGLIALPSYPQIAPSQVK